jgi:hypothetical protein
MTDMGNRKKEVQGTVRRDTYRVEQINAPIEGAEVICILIHGVDYGTAWDYLHDKHNPWAELFHIGNPNSNDPVYEQYYLERTASVHALSPKSFPHYYRIRKEAPAPVAEPVTNLQINAEKSNWVHIQSLSERPEDWYVSIWYYSPSCRNKYGFPFGKKVANYDTVAQSLEWLQDETEGKQLNAIAPEEAWREGDRDVQSRESRYGGFAWFQNAAASQSWLPKEVWEFRIEHR